MPNQQSPLDTPAKMMFQELQIEPIDWDKMTHPEGYVLWDEDLQAAARVALALGKPLLLTGDPGVGKSEFSRWLTQQLGLGERLKFVVKSSTEATDLFYQYDTLGRFHDAQMSSLEKPTSSLNTTEKQDIDPLRYLSYNALGLAMLYSVGRQKAEEMGFISDNMNADFLDPFPKLPTRTVVLIDEIDKAPRDVPNDMLDEIDKMAFSIKEIGNRKLTADKSNRPVVVITSNSEKDLPEAFLRRCIYYHIPFPENPEHLRKIVLSRLSGRLAETSNLHHDAQVMLQYLRSDDLSFVSKPGVSELLDWLNELTRERHHLAMRLREHPNAHIAAKTTLMKHAEDQKQATLENWNQWLNKAGLMDEQGNS